MREIPFATYYQIRTVLMVASLQPLALFLDVNMVGVGHLCKDIRYRLLSFCALGAALTEKKGCDRGSW